MQKERGSALARKTNEELGAKILRYEAGSPLVQEKITKICNIISKLEKKDRLADVGCFDGAFFESYKKCGVKLIDGFDIIPDALVLANRRQIAGVQTFMWDLEAIRAPVPDLTYDVIVCADVIEHLYETGNLVRECHRILKPSGTFILLTPNLVSLWNRYLALRGRMPLGHPAVSPFVKTEEQVNLGHSRIGTAREWMGLLASAGFRLKSVEGLWSSSMSKIASFGRPTLSHTLIITCAK